jgi:hypothetical protein
MGTKKLLKKKLVVIIGLHGRIKKFPLSFVLIPSRETTSKQNKQKTN